MTTPSPTPEVPLPEPDVRAAQPLRFSPRDLWGRPNVVAYADARAAHAVEQERARVVADCDAQAAWYRAEAENKMPEDARAYKMVAQVFDGLALEYSHPRHLPSEESPHA